MALSDWQDKMTDFATIDVRGVAGNFFPGIKRKAQACAQGEGIHIVQSFDPLPLYAVMEQLGFEHHTEQVSPTEFHAYFYRAKLAEDEGTIPMRPAALTNFPLVDNDLAKVAVDFWDLTWNDERRALPQGTRLLLSMANAVGAGRMRQATRELVKAYACGVTSDELADVFELLAWNQGMGFFASEIGPSTLFHAFKAIRFAERQGKTRREVQAMLLHDYGEKNPDVRVG